MTGGGELPFWVVAATSLLLVAGAAITFVGALGLLRLGSFYERVHAPTLGTTIGTFAVALASMIYFSAIHGRPLVHEILIVIFVTVTTPVTLTILVRAARFRDTSQPPDDADRPAC
ncbi:MAG: monovalent cation/H(+) antiporter subunit G [Alphaproteobacteria bacterium]|nr:monovalent cation/H(+) antiporter subunit G [Alphaproteobacteria bacterium]